MRTGRMAALAGIVALGVAAAAARAAESSPILTTDEVKKLVDSGQYKDALKAMIRILELQGPAAAPYDRHEILMLRAECQLQLHINDAALATLETARKEAVAAGNDDHAAQAQALATLIQKSPGLIYRPRTGAVRKPISILDRTLRQAAYTALFADDIAPLQAKVKLALRATSLAPIAEAAKLAGSVRAVERAATGDNKQTAQITKDLTAQALKLLGNALDDFTGQTQRISDSANRVITENVTMTDAYGRTFIQQQTHRKGLTVQDVQTLKNIKGECAKIPAGAAELSQALGADATPFKSIATKADLLKEKVNGVLTEDYTNALH